MRSQWLIPRAMKIQTVRILFIFIGLLLSAQFYVALTISEPYPALLLPAFSTIPDNPAIASFRVSNSYFFAGADTFKVPSSRFLVPSVPPMERKIIVRNLFTSNSYLFKSADSSSNTIDVGAYRLSFNRSRSNTMQHRSEIKTYLKNIANQYFHVTPDSFKIHWYKHDVNLLTGKTDTSLAEILTLNL